MCVHRVRRPGCAVRQCSLALSRWSSHLSDNYSRPLWGQAASINRGVGPGLIVRHGGRTTWTGPVSALRQHGANLADERANRAAWMRNKREGRYVGGERVKWQGLYWRHGCRLAVEGWAVLSHAVQQHGECLGRPETGNGLREKANAGSARIMLARSSVTLLFGVYALPSPMRSTFPSAPTNT